MNETGEFSTLLRLEGGPEAPAVAFLVTVIEGADQGSTVLIDPSLPSRVYSGTSTSCELRLRDREVSRRHLALEVVGERLRVTDLGSTSGTTADGISLIEGFVSGGEVLRLGESTAMAVERRDALAGVQSSRAERFGRVIGASPEMQRLYPLCARLAATTYPVMIEGESGTGKEVLAEAIHEQGSRAKGPFAVFDCARVPPTVVEAELARVFEQARGGTLLVDEIAELDFPLQRGMLRVLERAENDDVRVVFTTRRDLDRLVEAGRFREDLFDRMSIARLELPPLRRRTGDVRRLALHFVRDIGGPAATLPPDLVAGWESDAWPDNVRALRDAVAHWLALDDLAAEPPSASAGADPFGDILAQRLPLVHARERVLAELERRYAERALAEQGGDPASAAEASGMARRHFANAGLSSADD